MHEAVSMVYLPAHAGHDDEGQPGKRKISDGVVVNDTQSVRY
jgi:hypothetical protein